MAAGARAAAAVPPGARRTAEDAGVERLWLAELQRISEAAAHELRNALNGVSVNLEVVRSRAGREGAAASLGSFAEAAAGQLEQVIAMTEALVALSRPLRTAASVGRVADQVAALLRPALVASGRTVTLSVEGEGATSVGPDVVRLLVGGSLRAAAATLDDGGELRCRVRPAGGVEMYVTASGKAPPRIDDELQRVADAHAVRTATAGDSITLTFPA